MRRNWFMPTTKEIKFFFLNNVFTSVAFFILYLYAKTLRVQIEGVEKIQSHLEGGGRVIFASWHQRLFGGFFIPGLLNWSPCIMISQSRDGDFVSKIVERIGWIPVRGSSSRGGAKALRIMVQKVAETRIGVHIVDGPTGPPRIIKPGLVTLARTADAAISPTIISYERAWTFMSWDRFMIPKPFSRICVRFGPIFPAPEILNNDQSELFRKRLEDDMREDYKMIDHSWNT